MSSVDQTVVIIGSPETDHVAIGPLFAIDSFGYGWMTASGTSGSFSASIKTGTSRHDLAALITCLKTQHANPAAQQSWVSSDGELQIGFSGSALGSICASVKLAVHQQNRTLSYDLDLDQSYLPDLMFQLSTILASMPEAQS